MKKLIRHFIFDLLINVVALYLIIYWFDAIYLAISEPTFKEQLKVLVLAGVLLGLANAILKPIIKFLAFPFILFSFGLFYLVINAFILWLVTLVIPEIVITGLLTYFLAALVLSLVNTFLSWLFRD